MNCLEIPLVLDKFFRKTVSSAAAAAVAITCAASPAGFVCAQNVPDYPSLAEEIVILVNEARADAGLNPVYAAPLLYDAAEVRAIESVEKFSHYRPDSTLFNTVLDEYQFFYSGAAENIAAGNSTPEATFEQWKNSPDHWSSIMNPSYTHMGVGVYYEEGTEYGWYWEQLFIASDAALEGQYIPERTPIVPISYGDIDGDGIITSFDYLLLLKLVNKQVVLNDLQVESADCMRDGAVTVADAVVLKKYLLEIYDTLPIYP